MLINWKFLLLTFLLLSSALLIGCVTSGSNENQDEECEKNSDCKLIYGGCNCIAVPITDQRESYEDGAICVRNECDGLTEKVKAVCKNNKCVKQEE